MNKFDNLLEIKICNSLNNLFSLLPEPKQYEKGEMEEWIIKQAEHVSLELDLDISAGLLDASIRPSASNQ